MVDTDVQELRSYVAVVDHRGMGAASRALRIPKSTLSRHLANLERAIGAELIERDVRDFQLTEAGRAVYEHASRIMSELNAMTNATRQGPLSGLLRVTTTFNLVSFALRPLLPTFLKRYPTIDIEIEASSQRRDLLVDSFDVALRAGPLSGEALIARRLGKIGIGLFAAPGITETKGKLSVGLSVSDPPKDGSTSTPRLSLNDPLLVKEMLVSGYGTAWLPIYLCRDAVKAGKLVRLRPNQTRRGPEIFLLFRKSRQASPRVRVFVDYLAETLTFD